MLETLGDLLRHPQPPLQALEAAKRLARDKAKSDSPTVPAEISTVLYLASIAAALVRHERKISKSDDDVLQYELELMLRQPWLDDTTRDLLQQGRAYLNRTDELRTSESQ